MGWVGLVFKFQRNGLARVLVLGWSGVISAYKPSNTYTGADKVRRHALELGEGVHFGIRVRHYYMS